MFYVSTEEQQVMVPQWEGYVTVTPQPPAGVPHLPPILYQKPVFQIPDRIGQTVDVPMAYASFPREIFHPPRTVAAVARLGFGTPERLLRPAGVVVTAAEE